MGTPFYQHDWALGKGYVRMSRAGTHPYQYSIGRYAGPDGLVAITREWPSERKGSHSERGFTSLETVFEGRAYRRSFKRFITDRGLARMCRRFIADLKDQSQ